MFLYFLRYHLLTLIGLPETVLKIHSQIETLRNHQTSIFLMASGEIRKNKFVYLTNPPTYSLAYVWLSTLELADI